MEIIFYEGYSGTRLYIVDHPDYKDGLYVFAPSAEAAITAAALKWGRRWQDYDFYAYCEVRLKK